MHPSQFTIAGAGLLALVVSFFVWPVLGFVITLVHEGGHAMAGSVMGGKVKSLTLHAEHSGLTTVGGLGPLGTFMVLFGGYVAPSGFGILGAMLLAHDQVRTVLWVTLFLIALVLFAARNNLARFTAVVVGVVIAVVLRKASDWQTTFFAYTWIWFLLLGGLGHVLVFQSDRSTRKDTGSDAFQLRKLTLLPASFWSGVFWLASVCALVFGGGILLRYYHVGP